MVPPKLATKHRRPVGTSIAATTNLHAEGELPADTKSIRTIVLPSYYDVPRTNGYTHVSRVAKIAPPIVDILGNKLEGL